jgi:hypothetical protein
MPHPFVTSMPRASNARTMNGGADDPPTRIDTSVANVLPVRSS